MVPHVFSAGGVVLQNADMAAPVGFAALASQQVELGNQYRTLRQHAQVWESQVAITGQSPSIQMGSTQVGTMLDLMDAIGTCITSQDDPARPGLDTYLAQHDKCDARDLTDCRQFNFAEGYLFPGSLSAAHGDVAQMTATAVGTSSSANHPLAYEDGVDAPTGLADTESFGLYQQTVGGVLLPGCKSLNIEFGVTALTESADGAYWPEWVSVDTVATRITLSGINPKWLAAAAIPIGGKELTHANTTLTLGRHATDGLAAWENLAGDVNIKITVAGLAAISTAANASGESGAATTDLMIVALHDGTNNPLVIDTTAALSA